MGQKVSDSVTIAASPETVLAVITDIEAYPSWAEGMQSAEVLETDAEGRPARARFAVDAKVVEVAYTLSYAYQGTEEVSWTLVEGETITQLDGAYVLEDQGDVTKVTYTLEADVDIPLPGFMKKRAAKQILDTGLSGLKKRAEAV
ncbi:MAG: SRPBCC family protein [Actinomycetes bacterium]|jgi:ribosome-associated toxin RatA of RatAB toxin-antitoxin module